MDDKIKNIEEKKFEKKIKEKFSKNLNATNSITEKFEQFRKIKKEFSFRDLI